MLNQAVLVNSTSRMSKRKEMEIEVDDDDDLENEIAHLNLTDEQRQEMGLAIKKKPTVIDISRGKKIFDIIYNLKSCGS